MKRNRITLGCDPEFFIKNGGRVIGSEKVLGDGIDIPSGKIIVDGVQAELNPMPSTCRVVLGDNISRCFKSLLPLLKNGHTADFSQGVDVSINEYNSLREESKKFGCKPSYNVNSDMSGVIGVDPSVYMVRSAGGHIHLGSTDPDTLAILQNPVRLVPVLDTILGNTCVLLDRSEANVERRKYYGRAGEYRTPSYGIEYRTLSNFWLRSYQLMSLVTGLARQAVDIVGEGLDKELMSLVDYKDIVRAINNNDAVLARSNFDKIKDILTKSTAIQSDGYYPIDTDNLAKFEHFTTIPLEISFPTDPITHWTQAGEREIGFNNYLTKMAYD